jgi:hypothetical protein
MGCVWLIVRDHQFRRRAQVDRFGVLAGIGFENKYSIAFLLFGCWWEWSLRRIAIF